MYKRLPRNIYKQSVFFLFNCENWEVLFSFNYEPSIFLSFQITFFPPKIILHILDWQTVYVIALFCLNLIVQTFHQMLAAVVNIFLADYIVDPFWPKMTEIYWEEYVHRIIILNTFHNLNWCKRPLFNTSYLWFFCFTKIICLFLDWRFSCVPC